MSTDSDQMWGGRFEGGIDPHFAAFQRSLPFDRALLGDDLVGSMAWARALGAAGVLGASEVSELEGALEALGAELAEDPTPLDTSDAEDIHGFVEAALEKRLGPLARKLHTGRS